MQSNLTHIVAQCSSRAYHNVIVLHIQFNSIHSYVQLSVLTIALNLEILLMGLHLLRKDIIPAAKTRNVQFEKLLHSVQYNEDKKYSIVKPVCLSYVCVFKKCLEGRNCKYLFKNYLSFKICSL